MNGPNQDCWVWSPRPLSCRLVQQSGCLILSRMSHQEGEEEEEDEEAGEPSAICWCTGARWSFSEPAAHSGIPHTSGVAGRGPSAAPSVIDGGEGDSSQHVTEGHCWRGPGREAEECVCVYEQKEAEGLGPCWSEAPYVYYGLRTNLVVGVEVVEEVAVEDTIEVITDDIYTDDLLQSDHLYPS